MKNNKAISIMFIIMGGSGILVAVGTVILSYLLGESISLAALIFLGFGIYFTRMGIILLKQNKEQNQKK